MALIDPVPRTLKPNQPASFQFPFVYCTSEIFPNVFQGLRNLPAPVFTPITKSQDGQERESDRDTAVTGPGAGPSGCTGPRQRAQDWANLSEQRAGEGPPVVGWRTSQGLKMGHVRNDLSSH